MQTGRSFPYKQNDTYTNKPTSLEPYLVQRDTNRPDMHSDHNWCRVQIENANRERYDPNKIPFQGCKVRKQMIHYT